ncbi:MAG TPA: hypothetical protein VGJ14_05860 [Sporichthyaceae bacterium]|jgi:uncharacterized protein YndB with AHSA1/START domain
MPYTMGFATECEIAATPERVWELLTNAPGYRKSSDAKWLGDSFDWAERLRQAAES